MADSQQNGVIMAEPPHSIAQASVDEKGRLKLPAEFLEYLEALKVTKVFITTFDQRQARIYPIAVWKVNEALFENSADSRRPSGWRCWRKPTAATRRSTSRDACCCRPSCAKFWTWKNSR